LSALLRIVELEGHLALRARDTPGIAATLWARLLGDPAVSGLISHRDEALADSPVAVHPMPDRPDRRLVRVSSGYADRIRAVCWQPDGAKLAAGSADGMVRIFDTAGSVMRAVDLGAEINALAWSLDRIHVAALTGESELCLVEPILGEVTRRRTADGELTCLAWTPSGLAAGCRDGGVLIWDSESDQVTRCETASVTPVQAMQWGGQELGLVLAHSDGTVARCRGGALASTKTGLNVPRTLTVRPGGTEVAIGAAASSGLVLVDMNGTPPEIVAVSAPTPGWITSAGWSHDGTWLAAGLQDGAVALWSSARNGVRDLAPDLDARRTAWEDRLAAQPLLDYHGQRVAALAWHPAESMVAVATHTDTRLFDLSRDPDPVSRSGVNCLRRHPYRGLFAVGGMDGELIFLSATGTNVRHTFQGHSGGVRTLAFDPAGERLITAAEQGPMLLWDLRGIGEGEASATPLRCPVQLTGAVAWSPDGALVAVGGDKQIAVLDASSLRELSRFDVADLVNGLDFDPSGRWLAVATTSRDVGVCRVSGERARWLSSHVSTVSAVRWIDEGRLASAGYDGQLIIWSPWEGASGTVLETIDPGGGAAWDVTATRTAIATVTYAGLLSLHPLHGGQPACTIALDTALSSCDVSADATMLAVAGSAGTALFRLPEWAAGA
jgi:WD40 repeat protein